MYSSNVEGTLTNIRLEATKSEAYGGKPDGTLMLGIGRRKERVR